MVWIKVHQSLRFFCQYLLINYPWIWSWFCFQTDLFYPLTNYVVRECTSKTYSSSIFVDFILWCTPLKFFISFIVKDVILICKCWNIEPFNTHYVHFWPNIFRQLFWLCTIIISCSDLQNPDFSDLCEIHIPYFRE